MEYTADDYREVIKELLEGISDAEFLRMIYSLIVLKLKRTGE